MDNLKNKSSDFYLSKKQNKPQRYVFSKGRLTNIFWSYDPKYKPYGNVIIKK